MRRFAFPLVLLVGGCDAQAGVETAIAFVLLFGTLARLFVDDLDLGR